MTKIDNIILHIPHSSTYIPTYDGFVANKEEIDDEINILTDWFTNDLFDLSYNKIITTFTRVFCDVERFPDDLNEVMSKFGMGMCYTHFDSGKLMRNVSQELREKIKIHYYDMHHKSLEMAVDECLSNYKTALIIDCHSFPDKPLRRDLQIELPRPDFCIGTDEFHTPKKTASYVYKFFASRGFVVKFNNPYAGTMIPLKYFKRDKMVSGIMIEVNRKLYLKSEHNTIARNNNFQNIKKLINELIVNIL